MVSTPLPKKKKKNSYTYFRANCITLYDKVVNSNKKQ